MTVYSIRNWNEHFENNRSRQIDKVSWVAIPNRHDGENFSKIMADSNAAILFASWVLLVQIASKCNPRGVLLRGDGSPHTDASLTLKCRCPDAWMTLALKWFPDNTDWLESKEFTNERQLGVSRASHERQLGDIEGNGIGGRKEGNGTLPHVIRISKEQELKRARERLVKLRQKDSRNDTEQSELKKLKEAEGRLLSELGMVI